MTQPIGIFDSGIGGLSILKALRTELPSEHFIYIADSGHAPYGERDDAHVVERSLKMAAYLVGQNIKALGKTRQILFCCLAMAWQRRSSNPASPETLPKS